MFYDIDKNKKLYYSIKFEKLFVYIQKYSNPTLELIAFPLLMRCLSKNIEIDPIKMIENFINKSNILNIENNIYTPEMLVQFADNYSCDYIHIKRKVLIEKINLC